VSSILVPAHLPPPYSRVPYPYHLIGHSHTCVSSMPDTVEDIDRQIQQLIQQKKRVSDAGNLLGTGAPQKAVVTTSFQSTTSKSQFPRVTAKADKGYARGGTGHHKGIVKTTSTKTVSQEVCKTLACQSVTSLVIDVLTWLHTSIDTTDRPRGYR